MWCVLCDLCKRCVHDCPCVPPKLAAAVAPSHPLLLQLQVRHQLQLRQRSPLRRLPLKLLLRPPPLPLLLLQCALVWKATLCC